MYNSDGMLHCKVLSTLGDGLGGSSVGQDSVTDGCGSLLGLVLPAGEKKRSTCLFS